MSNLKKSNINLWNIKKHLTRIEKMVAGDINENTLSKFRRIDYRDYIETPLNNLGIAWKFEGGYFKEPSSLLPYARRNGYEKGDRTFTAILNNPDRQEEMWQYGIQLVYTVNLAAVNRILTCDGALLTPANYTVVRGDPSDGKAVVMVGGEYEVIYKANLVWKYFKDPRSDMSFKLLFHDGFFGNCGIDNLSPRISNR